MKNTYIGNCITIGIDLKSMIKILLGGTLYLKTTLKIEDDEITSIKNEIEVCRSKKDFELRHPDKLTKFRKKYKMIETSPGNFKPKLEVKYCTN